MINQSFFWSIFNCYIFGSHLMSWVLDSNFLLFTLNWEVLREKIQLFQSCKQSTIYWPQIRYSHTCDHLYKAITFSLSQKVTSYYRLTTCIIEKYKIVIVLVVYVILGCILWMFIATYGTHSQLFFTF